MAGGVSVSFTGNLTKDPVLRALSSGAHVTSLSVACNERIRDIETGEWRNAATTFLDVSVWNDTARNVASTLRRGDAVVIAGMLRTREYEFETEDKTKEKRTVLDVKASSISVDLSRMSGRFSRIHYETVQAADGGTTSVPVDTATGEILGSEPEDLGIEEESIESLDERELVNSAAS